MHMLFRDLKPVNIFIDSHDNIKIGDFGLATTELIGSVPAEDIRKEDMDQVQEKPHDNWGKKVERLIDIWSGMVFSD